MVLTDEQKKVWWENSTYKTYRLHFPDSNIEDICNSRICSESMTITDSLCSEEDIIFGSCCSAQFEIQIADLTEEIKGLEFEAYVTCDGVEVQLGTYIVTSAEKTSDKRYKKVTAYDRMNRLNEDVSDWYASLFTDDTTEISLKQFRDSFFEHIGITQESISLINDDLIVRKTVSSNKMTGIEVIQAVCEINGVFGHFDRSGTFCYVSISSDEELLPKYIISDYEEYYTHGINRLQIRQENGDIGYATDSVTDAKENGYIVTGNFLMYGMSSDELKLYGDRLFEKIQGISYKPSETEYIGLPYIELGKRCSVSSPDGNFSSIIMSHTISGGQYLKSVISASGNQYRDEAIEGLNYEFNQLMGKTNMLERTVEGTVSKVADLEVEINGEKGIATIVQQLSGQIITEVIAGGETVSRFAQELGRFLFEGDTFEINTDNILIKGDVLEINNGYIGNLRIGSEGLSSDDYETLQIFRDGTGKFTNLSGNGKGSIYLKPKKNEEDEYEEAVVPFFKTKDGFHADYDSVANKSANMHCDSDGYAHYGLVSGDMESSNEVADAEIVLKPDGAYIQKGNGILLPINASNIGNVGILNYSLEEQLIGTWLDGKNLYQKTKHFGKLPNSGMKSVDHGIELLDSVINLNGFYYNPIEDVPLYHNIPYVGNPGNTLDVVNVSANNTAINVITGNDKSLYDSYITLMYTKREKDTYTELLYVKTNQKFYMMTDYIPNVDTRLLFECDFYTHSDRRANFGVSTGDAIFYLTSEGTGVNYVPTGWFHSGDWDKYITFGPYNGKSYSTKFYKYEFGNNYVRRNGEETSLDRKEFVNDKPLCLFAIPTYDSEGNITTYTGAHPTSELWSIKSLKIYEGDNIKREYIPVIGTDGIPCLYEKVRHKFLKSIDSTPLPSSNYELKVRDDLANLGTPWWISTNPSAISINNSDNINKITINSVGGFEKIYVRRRSNSEQNNNYLYTTRANRIKVEFKVRSLNVVGKNIEDFSVCSAFTYCDGSYNSKPLDDYRENLNPSYVKGHINIELNGDNKWHTYSYEISIPNGFISSDYIMIFDFSNVKDETTAELEIKDLTFTGYIDT